MNARIEGTKLIIEIDMSKGMTLSKSGKFQMFSDIPPGWQTLIEDEEIEASMTIGKPTTSRKNRGGTYGMTV